MSEAKRKFLAEIEAAVNAPEADLQEVIDAASHKLAIAIRDLREIANSSSITGWEALHLIKTLADRIADAVAEEERAEDALDKHDDPDKWREWAEAEFSDPRTDQENFTSWG